MSNEKKSRLVPVTKWNDYHLWPTIGGLRHLIANAKRKKFDHVVVKANGRVLIDEDAFLQWAKDKENH
jgi:hypothetical protein